MGLAGQCVIAPPTAVNGWDVDAWEMDELDVDAAISVYSAILQGGATDPVMVLLTESGIDLSEALIDAEHRKDDITRSDLTELTAAASLIAVPGCDIDSMYMPNVPKMSRRKSDSGVDIFVAYLRESAEGDDLHNDEYLTIASVKHSIDNSTSGMRWKLVNSLSERELSIPYLATQLRVLNARLRQEGYIEEDAARIYLFLREFPNPDRVDLFAIGVVEPALEDDLTHHVTLLPSASQAGRSFRMIFLPGLNTIHQRCP